MDLTQFSGSSLTISSPSADPVVTAPVAPAVKTPAPESVDANNAAAQATDTSPVGTAKAAPPLELPVPLTTVEATFRGVIPVVRVILKDTNQVLLQIPLDVSGPDSLKAYSGNVRPANPSTVGLSTFA